MTQYREFEGSESVDKELLKYTPISKESMSIMVKVVASREKWILDKFTIVVDKVLEDDWRVGEVEMMVDNQENVDAAKRDIKELITEMGFSLLSFGKVEHCLE